jgi:hypothetical protein
MSCDGISQATASPYRPLAGLSVDGFSGACFPNDLVGWYDLLLGF